MCTAVALNSCDLTSGCEIAVCGWAQTRCTQPSSYTGQVSAFRVHAVFMKHGIPCTGLALEHLKPQIHGIVVLCVCAAMCTELCPAETFAAMHT